MWCTGCGATGASKVHEFLASTDSSSDCRGTGSTGITLDTGWSFEDLVTAHTINADIWLRSSEVQQQIQTPKPHWTEGELGVQRIMRGNPVVFLAPTGALEQRPGRAQQGTVSRAGVRGRGTGIPVVFPSNDAYLPFVREAST